MPSTPSLARRVSYEIGSTNPELGLGGGIACMSDLPVALISSVGRAESSKPDNGLFVCCRLSGFAEPQPDLPNLTRLFGGSVKIVDTWSVT